MTRDLNLRWWRCAVAFALLLALALLLVPQVQHGHASLLFIALVQVLWLFSAVATQPQSASFDEQIVLHDPRFYLPSLSHLPPPSTLA